MFPVIGTQNSSMPSRLKRTTTLLPYVRAVVGDIQVAMLDCDSLEGAEDATTLEVAISFDEVSQRIGLTQRERLVFYRSIQLKAHLTTYNLLVWTTLDPSLMRETRCIRARCLVTRVPGCYGKEDLLHLLQRRIVRRQLGT